MIFGSLSHFEFLRVLIKFRLNFGNFLLSHLKSFQMETNRFFTVGLSQTKLLNNRGSPSPFAFKKIVLLKKSNKRLNCPLKFSQIRLTFFKSIFFFLMSSVNLQLPLRIFKSLI